MGAILFRSKKAIAAFMLVALFGTSCRTASPLPPVNLSSPGWHVQQGQAVWRPSRARPELTGELLLATNANGSYFVQFSKNPFPLASARCDAGTWQIEFGDGRHIWRGHGEPPRRFAWFQLPPALVGRAAATPWRFTRLTDGSWRLDNPRSGEFLEGQFFP
jgi:hypothetical protein